MDYVNHKVTYRGHEYRLTLGANNRILTCPPSPINRRLRSSDMPFTTKDQAISAAADRGYTSHEGTSRVGDDYWGSREFYVNPDEGRNRYGGPMSQAQISYLAWENHWEVFFMGGDLSGTTL